MRTRYELPRAQKETSVFPEVQKTFVTVGSHRQVFLETRCFLAGMSSIKNLRENTYKNLAVQAKIFSRKVLASMHNVQYTCTVVQTIKKFKFNFNR